MLAMLAPAAVMSFTAAADDDPRARKIMEEAFNRRYRWNEAFKGFWAEFLSPGGKDGRGHQGRRHQAARQRRGRMRRRRCQEACERDRCEHGHSHSPSSFEKAFGSCSFAIAGEGAHGGTKIAITGHGFFKDFTVKEGNIIENHGGHDAMSTEVKVQQIVWLAASGKTLPRHTPS